MGAQFRGNITRRGNFYQNGFGKPPLMRPPFNGHRPPFGMPPRVPFPPMRPPMMAPPPLRGMRPPPPPHHMRMMGPRPYPPPMRGFGYRRGPPPRRFPPGRVMKRQKFNELDLTKGWVSEALKEEFRRKEELLAKAKGAGTHKEEAWACYRTQRDRCSQMYHAAEMQFVGQQEETEWQYEEDVPSNESYCEICDQVFYSQEFLEKHISEHKICGLDGCQYTAHMSMIEKHIEEQHLTGLYEKIKSVNTPEEIAKWVEERKVKYPTKENVQKRYEKQEEMLKRGEKIGERKNRFGRDKTRLAHVKPKRNPRRKKTEPVKIQEKIISLIDEKCDWNGTMFPFRGTKDLYNEVVKENSDYDDEEWSSEFSNTPVVLNNGLGALMGAYKSSDEDDEPPTEVKIQKVQTKFPAEEETSEKKTSKRVRKHCDRKSRKKPKIEEKIKIQKYKPRRVTLLEKLLDSEIRHERNVLLQCVHYVVSNNFFMDK